MARAYPAGTFASLTGGQKPAPICLAFQTPYSVMRHSFPLLLVGSLFLWAGMVGGISFLEAPLKFTAPHITTVLGVGIGRIVFAALTKVEIVLCTTALISGIYLRVPSRVWAGLVVLTLVLLVQTFGLLPALDARAIALQTGQPVAATLLHPAYIGLEILRFNLLLYTSVAAFRWLLRGAAHVFSNQPAGVPHRPAGQLQNS